MTQKPVAHTQNQRLQWFLIAQGLGWAGSIGILSSSVMAQSSADIVLDPPVNQSVEAALSLPQGEPQPIAPEPFAPEFAPSLQLAPVQPQAPVVLQAPQQSQATRAQATRAQPNHDSYAAPGSYAAPSSIVLSERSTGCQTVLQNNQRLNGGLCAVEPLAGSSGSRSGSTSAVRVGSLSVTSFANIATTPALRDYYNRTVRPAGRLGNGNIRLIFPLSIPAPISSIFGWRVHPITGDQRFHSGTDLAAPLGTPVLAAYAGQVAIADFLGGYGLAVTLEHNKGTQQTLYGHLSEIFVKPGERIKQGDVIGRVGSTGNSTGPHLHFEFRQLAPDGWVAMDAGAQLEYALAQLVKAMQVAQKSQGTRS